MSVITNNIHIPDPDIKSMEYKWRMSLNKIDFSERQTFDKYKHSNRILEMSIDGNEWKKFIYPKDRIDWNPIDRIDWNHLVRSNPTD